MPVRVGALLAIALAVLASPANAQVATDSAEPAGPAGEGTENAPNDVDPAADTTAPPPTTEPEPQTTPAPVARAPEPEPTTPPPAPVTLSPTDDDEAEEEDEDSFGVLYIQPRFGYSFVNLVAFSQENFIPEAERITASGFHGGLGLGFRVYWVTLGAHVDLARFPDFHIGVVGPELALHFPIPGVQPYIRASIGYAWMGNPNFDDPSLSETDVTGLAAEAGLGLDIKLSRVISLGIGVDMAFLNLTRQGVSGATSIGMVDLEEDGDSVGLQMRAHGQLTIHI